MAVKPVPLLYECSKCNLIEKLRLVIIGGTHLAGFVGTVFVEQEVTVSKPVPMGPTSQMSCILIVRGGRLDRWVTYYTIGSHGTKDLAHLAGDPQNIAVPHTRE